MSTLEAPEQSNPELNILVATTITSGFVDEDYYNFHRELARWNDKYLTNVNVEYKDFRGPFVESVRDTAAEHTLKQGYNGLLFIDADMTGFPPNALATLLEDAFTKIPFADAVGAYCNLKSPPFLPTIDTGTGTWEPHYPGSGVLEVIRTGGAFLFIRAEALRRFGPPWFRSKISNKPLDALVNVDNFSRCKMSGRNKFFDTPDWQSLLMVAREAGPGEAGIGEDSGFCDRIKAAGGRIFVDTDVVVGHAGKEIITWQKLKESMDRQEKNRRLAVGVQG